MVETEPLFLKRRMFEDLQLGGGLIIELVFATELETL
jgi:hypothetical protein